MFNSCKYFCFVPKFKKKKMCLKILDCISQTCMHGNMMQKMFANYIYGIIIFENFYTTLHDSRGII